MQSFCVARNLPGSFARNFRGRLLQHTVLAITFAYELRFSRFLYQNRSLRRDEDNSCRKFSHTRPSWGHNQPNSVLIQNLSTSNTTSALEMRPDDYGPNIKVSPFEDTKHYHFEHFSIEAFLIIFSTMSKSGVNKMFSSSAPKD